MGLFDFFKKKKENDEEIALDKALNIKEINESEDEIAITNESSEIFKMKIIDLIITLC